MQEINGKLDVNVNNLTDCPTDALQSCGILNIYMQYSNTVLKKEKKMFLVNVWHKMLNLPFRYPDMVGSQVLLHVQQT